MRVLELFSGTGSVSKICNERGWEVISLDLKDADINIDILKWNYKELYPVGYFDYIHASPPCDTFSNLRRCWLGRTIKKHGDKIITKEILQQDIDNEGLPILNRTLDIIFHFQPEYWTIENPDGLMKNYMKGIPNYVVDYCMYSDWGYRKRTYIWSNIEGFEPKLCDKKCGNMIVIQGHIIHRNNCGNTKRLQLARKHKKTAGGRSGTSINDRYRIPPNLIKELFKCM